ncbi:MAG: xanthine dehydrogenase family protein molybdopterin-binding subunit [Armatimonadota bacterium]
MARKVKQVIVENGFEREVEIEVPDGPPASWGDLGQLRILGKRNPRPDGPDKVTGRAKYTSDVVLPGMCYGRFASSPYASARIAAIDVSPAEKIPGVMAVIPMKTPGSSVLYAGEFVAAVAAKTPEIAEDAIRAIKVTYEPRRHVVNLDKAMDPNSPKVRPDTESNLQFPGQQANGEVDAALAKADVVMEQEYHAQTRLHTCLETHGHTAKWDGDRLTVWSSTQFITGIRDSVANDFAGGDQSKVRVICEHMGGGFGSKFGLGPEGDMAIKLAKAANAPVRFMLTRYDEQIVNFRGPGYIARVKLAASKDGTLLAADVKNYRDGGAGNAPGYPLDQGFYIIEPQARRATSVAVLTNTGGTAALRAPGHPQAALIWDMALDELAAKLNMDPLELRRKNHSDPVRVQEWEIGARVIGWDRRQKTPGAAPGVRKRGIGLGSAIWGGGGRKSADCSITVGKDGSVKVYSGVQDLGTGLRLYVQGIVAEELGLKLDEVTPLIGHSEYGPGHASGGSTTTGSVAPPVKMAALDAKDKLVIAAAQALKAKPEEVELVTGGTFRVKGQPAKSLTWKQLCATLPAAGLKAHGEWNPDLQAGGVAGCTFAEVEVDTETGKVTVLKVVGVQDCGLVLNRLQAESQVTGGIIQGIGTALLERKHLDNLTGRMLNPNLEEYKLCGSFEAGGINITMDPPYRTLRPEEQGVVTIIYDTPTGKVSGIGEPAVIGVQAAVANAIFNAIGTHVTSLPATPDRVLAALASKKGAATRKGA